ncbi:MAG: cytochrome P450, partial [Acidimicrobiales bacterium]
LTVARSSSPASARPSALGSIAAAADLTPDELCSNVAVVMFGAVETSEAMTANALFHLLSHPRQLAALDQDRSLLANAIEESLRLEPAASVVDRYATADVRFGRPGDEQLIGKGELVRLSLTAANHDPSTFAEPHRFDIRRHNASAHLAFVKGPHACIGAHMATLETAAAVEAVLDLLPGITIDDPASARPRGLIFRKPDRLDATWPT